ncbi:MAG: TerB family tellurite resistance protein [Rhodothermales bacterium]
MQTEKDSWTQTHDLALIYIALAYGTDHQLSDEELDQITAALQSQREGMSEEEVQVIVMETMAIYLGGEVRMEAEVTRSMQSLKAALSPEERRRVLEDVVRIAEADGVILLSERSLIRMLAELWGIKATAGRLLERSTVPVEALPEWSLLHDISLVYLVLAHATDNELSDDEIEVMIERLQEWQPDLAEEDVRGVLRGALQVYADEPDEDALGASVSAIREGLPVVQRLAVLDDLTHIAEADGTVNEHEEQMISTLSQAWGITVRLNGKA